MVLLALPPADHLWTNVCARARDAGRRAELRITGAAAQTRMVSVARIRLVSRKSTRLFKGIICDDISEFESYLPSQPVRSPPPNMGRPQKTAWYRGISQISLGLRVRSWVTAAPCSTGRQRMPHSEKLAVRPRRIYEEPGRSDDELLAFDNVILTPHLAGHHVLMDSETSKI